MSTKVADNSLFWGKWMGSWSGVSSSICFKICIMVEKTLNTPSHLTKADPLCPKYISVYCCGPYNLYNLVLRYFLFNSPKKWNWRNVRLFKIRCRYFWNDRHALFWNCLMIYISRAASGTERHWSPFFKFNFISNIFHQRKAICFEIRLPQ